MYISDDGIKLHIELEMPEKAPDKVPLVIVNHGFTGHMEEDHIVAAARACREKGYATLRVEMYGHGQSGGDFKDHTLFKWISKLIMREALILLLTYICAVIPREALT